MDAIDLAVMLAFREPATPSEPPVADGWYADAIARSVARVSADKRIIALGNFGYAWQSGRAEPERLPYVEAMARAADNTGGITFGDESGSARIRFFDQGRRLNDVWLLDGVTIYNQLGQLGLLQSIAIWPLGYEDAAVWALLDTDPTPQGAVAVLSAPVDLSATLRLQGQGPLATAAMAAVPGVRTVVQDPVTGQITGQTYAVFPEPGRIQRGGAGAPDSLTLTFEGLPAADHVGPLLALLADRNIKATCFVDAGTMLQHEASANRIIATGYGMGLTMSQQD